MRLVSKVLFTIICILVISSCSLNKKQAASELIQTAKSLVEKGDLTSATSVLNAVDKISPNMNEVSDARRIIEQKEMEKRSIKENPLRYSFLENGIQIEVDGIVKTRNTDKGIGIQLSEGETWIILNTVLKDQANKYHQTNWRGYFRLVTKTGDALSPSIPLIISSQNGTPDFIQGNERKELRILFRAKESDAPWRLRFSNGVENELVF